MGQPIEQRGRHLGVAEDARPFAEAEIGGDDDRGALVEPADQMEEELAAGLSEGQIAEFVEDNKIDAGEIIGEAALPAGAGFALQPVDEVDDSVKAASGAAADAASRDGDGEMRLAGTGAADQHGVALLGEEGAAGRSRTSASLTGVPVKSKSSISLAKRQLGDGQLILDRARLLLGDLGVEQVADDARRLMPALEAVAITSS